MKDICIRFNCTLRWGFKFIPDEQKITVYKKWIKENLEKTAYYFPRSYPDRVYFLNAEDVSLFTLIHGRVYDYMGEGHIDMSKIEKMILHETALERNRQNEKNND